MIEYRDLTDNQARAVGACVESIRSGSRITKLSGFAGTDHRLKGDEIKDHWHDEF